MPLMEGFLTIKETAESLGLSTKTIRRRIQKGELRAELKDSVYGQQYFIPEGEINTAKQIIDVVKVRNEYDVQELAITLAQYLKERDERLEESIKKLETCVDSLREDNSKLREEVLKAQEEHYRELDNKLRMLMDSKKEEKKKNIFSFFKK